MNNLLTSFQNLKATMRKRSHRLAGLTEVQLLQQCRPGTDEAAAEAILRGSQPLYQHDWATIASNLGRLAAQAGLQPITAAKLKAGEILRASATIASAKVAVAQSRPLISSINPRNHKGYTPRQAHTPHRAATPKPAKPHVVRPAKPAVLKPPPKPKPVRNLPVNSDRLEYTIRKAGLTFIAMARKVNQSNTVVYYWLKHSTCYPGVPAALGVTAENLLEPLSAEQKQELETLRHPAKKVKAIKEPKQCRRLPVNPDRLEYTIRKAGLTFIAMARKVNQSNTVVYSWLKQKTCHPDAPAVLGVTAESLREPLSLEQMQELETLRHPPKATKEPKPKKEPVPKLPSVAQSILAKISDEGLKAAATNLFTRLGAKQARAIARARKALKTAAFNASSQDFDLLALVILRT